MSHESMTMQYESISVGIKYTYSTIAVVIGAYATAATHNHILHYEYITYIACTFIFVYGGKTTSGIRLLVFWICVLSGKNWEYDICLCMAKCNGLWDHIHGHGPRRTNDAERHQQMEIQFGQWNWKFWNNTKYLIYIISRCKSKNFHRHCDLLNIIIM